MAKEINFKVVYGSPPQTPEEKCYSLFGKSIDALVHEILINENGKYNSLYGK